MENFEGLKEIKTLNNQIKEDTISVTQLNRLAKTLLENNMPICWVSGELSGVKRYSHVYFDLKDEAAKVSCVLFAGNLAHLDFSLENGVKVEVRGRVTVYPTNGSYQINVERIRKLGIGDLWEAYNRLLAKLKTQGLFDEIHKKKIPVFPRAIGVITSKEGSVVRDVITTLNRRMPNIPVVIYHSAVQGQDASMQIAKAINIANTRKEVDVLIICRGGGSLEDLWCFNEEVVARYVFESQIPIISAVGHETDTTIIDFVADLRAPTPTAAAELVAKSKKEWEILIDKLHLGIIHQLNNALNTRIQTIDLYFSKLKALNPINQLKEKHLKLSNLTHKLSHALTNRINKEMLQINRLGAKLMLKKINLTNYSNKIGYLSSNLQSLIKQKIKDQQKQLDGLTYQLELVNPYSILGRGYAIVQNEHGQIVYASNEVNHNEKITILLKDDEIKACVDKKDILPSD